MEVKHALFKLLFLECLNVACFEEIAESRRISQNALHGGKRWLVELTRFVFSSLANFCLFRGPGTAVRPTFTRSLGFLTQNLKR